MGDGERGSLIDYIIVAMKTLIESPPRTIMEVFHLLPEGTWVEVINGAMTMLPSLSYQHQNVVMKILVAIANTAMLMILAKFCRLLTCI